MASEQWVPPAMEPEEFSRLTTVEDGFPEYMRDQVNDWVFGATGGYDSFDEAVQNSLSLLVKRPFGSGVGDFISSVEDLDDDDLANVIDCMLFHGFGSARRDVGYVATILDKGLSEWAVTGGNRPRLTRRIPAGLQVSYDHVVSETARAGRLLAEAFEAAYGPTPNPNHAYDLSVKAVETLACPLYIPNNTTRATLGAVIGHLEQKNISLPLQEKNATHKEVITKMMRLLWEGGERHGSGTYEHVSLEGARTAQAIAFSLVAMIHEGVINVG